MLTDKFPRAVLAHTPTPVERLDNLSDELGGPKIWIKRDDCTGLAFGGNKARQLEYYFGEAVQDNADTILITSAVQSNYSRTAVAAARKYGMDAVV
ncbi:MAG: pyridoxal-phosphate dependent enzyme, partial [Kordiimonadaceae bacterium]|nr:pyridoxal-phosphate dependent enzyme [Kordiimonadaceae bacterium]